MNGMPNIRSRVFGSISANFSDQQAPSAESAWLSTLNRASLFPILLFVGPLAHGVKLAGSLDSSAKQLVNASAF